MNKTAASALVGVVCLMMSHANALELRFNSFEPPRTIASEELVVFFQDLAKKTNGALTGRLFAGGQLLNGPATLKGIGDGVVDGGVIVSSLNQGELKNTNVIPDLLPYVIDGLVASAASVQTAIVDCAECQNDFKAANVVWLGGHGPTPWNMMCKSEVASLADLRGRRIRVTGASATRMIQALGGVAVQLNTAEIAAALQGGQIDCAVGPSAWLSDLGILPSIKTVIDYAFGVYGGLGVYVFNRDRWNGLPADQKKVLLELISANIVKGSLVYREKEQSERAKARAAGIGFWKPDAEFEARMDEFRKNELPNLANDMRKRGVSDPDKLIKLHLANIEKWKKKVAETNGDANRLIGELRQEVYAKVPLN